MIGIVGGAGPLAGNNLFKKIIQETKASGDQEHLPVLLWSAPTEIPDRTEFLEGRTAVNPGKPISSILLKLETCGASVAGIACNTAHASVIFDEIQNELEKHGAGLRLIHMIRETIDFIQKHYPEGIKVGVLSTTGTRQARLYIDLLEEAGFPVLSPGPREQERVHAAIYDKKFGVKATGVVTAPESSAIFYKAMDRLLVRGAEVIILGCTEIPLVVQESEYRGVPVIDSLKILARALIRTYAPDKLRPLNA